MFLTLLALDLGTQMGWSLLHNGLITSGTFSFKNDRYQGGGMRYLRFLRWLNELKAAVEAPISAIYFEEVRRHLGVDAAHVYGGFLAMLTSWCESQRIPYEGVSVGTIKHHATGKGNASKKAVLSAIQAKGYEPQDDNEADALALMEWVKDQRLDQALDQGCNETSLPLNPNTPILPDSQPGGSLPSDVP